MKRFLFAKLQEWKARLAQGDQYSDQNGAADQQLGDNFSKEEATYQHHFLEAFNSWQKLSPETRHEQWRLECQKAYAEEYDRHQGTRDRLDQLEQEIHRLRDQLDQQKAGHIPADFEISSIPVSRTTMAAVKSEGLHELQHWDYDHLLEKWKHRIHEQRSTQHPLPTVPSLSPGRPLNGTPSAYDHRALEDQHSYQDDDDKEMEDEDLVDAPGEDEDEDVTGTTSRNGMVDREVLDPDLRHSNGSLDDGGRMLMELKGFQEANGEGGTGR